MGEKVRRRVCGREGEEEGVWGRRRRVCGGEGKRKGGKKNRRMGEYGGRENGKQPNTSTQ